MEVAEYYFENYLYDIITDFVPNGKSEDAINSYVNMTNDLKRMYGITNEVSNDDINNITNMIKNKNYKVKKKTK